MKALTLVLSDKKTLDQALEETGAGLPADARAWLTEITSGTLRWLPRLELAIDAQALKKKPSGGLRKSLLLAAYQLIVQDRTAHAPVVSETVDLIRKKDGEAPAKFANALLRKVSEQASQWRELPRPKETGSKIAERAAWAALPEWWMARLEKDHGTQWALAFAQASLERPKLWIRARDGAAPAGFSAGPIEGSFVAGEGAPRGAITEWPGFREGAFFVQDLASQILVHEVTKELKPGAAIRRVLDRCAAPGGKSAGLQWSGWTVVATDLDGIRMRLLEETVKRVAPEVRVIPSVEAKNETVDVIWVDAPCSGSGIVRRHPDVKWLKQEKDLASLETQQVALVRDAWNRLPSGGALVYSVCSLFKSEGPGVLAKAELAPAREWWLAPHLEPSTDGFYGALLRKP